MKFKVGDKVRCVVGGDSYHGKIARKGQIYTADIKDDGKVPNWAFLGLKELGGGLYLACNFELVEQPEPQVGDVWGSEDKSRVVRVVGKFERNDITWISFLRLNGEYKGVATYDTNELFAIKCPLLLHRPPKKQEEVWERISQSNEDYRCGNKIKVIYQGYEGLAVCNKHDKFDLMFGVNLAAHRAMVKYHQNVIAEMIKEEQK